MQSARTILAILLSLLCGQVIAEPLRVGVIRLDSSFVDASEAASAEADRKRLRDVAGALRRRQFDVILVSEIRSRQSCNLLANALKPAAYQVAVCSNFRAADGGGPPRQVAVLSTQPPLAAWAEEWQGPAQVDSPGGFAFAAFRQGTNTAGFFVLHGPDSENASSAAARYVMHHVNWVESKVTNGIAALMIAGGKDWLSETAGAGYRIFSQAGFQDALAFTFADLKDGLLMRQGEFDGSVETVSTARATCPLIKGEWHIRATATGRAPPNPSDWPGPLARLQPYALAYQEELSWGGGILAAIIFIGIGVWRLRRARKRAMRPGPSLNSTFVVEVEPAHGMQDRFAVRSSTVTDSTHPPNPDTQVDVWQKRALLAEERAREAAAQTRAGLMPLFAGVMKQRLFTWLTAQRSYLITAHEIGTQQVVEMEQRLVKLQDQFEARLKADQQRIAELEEEVASKERTIRDLLRAQVRAASRTSERKSDGVVE